MEVMAMHGALIMIRRGRYKINANGQLTLCVTEFNYVSADGRQLIGSPDPIAMDEEVMARIKPYARFNVFVSHCSLTLYLVWSMRIQHTPRR